MRSKRQAIEALLCAAGDNNFASLVHALASVGGGHAQANDALDATYRRHPSSAKLRFGDRLACAAYLLIESSPALRREWFGGRR